MMKARSSMQTPTEIRIGPILVPIQELSSLGDKQQFGEYESYPAGRIAISPDLGSQQKALTLFHEILHAIDDQYGLSLTERHVRVLEMSLSQMFKDNPQFTKQYLKHL